MHLQRHIIPKAPTMVKDTDAVAALILHKQVELSRQFVQPRPQAFASSVANRFFTDGSLDRQRRVVECTKRRQAKAHAKAAEQQRELQHLRQQYEHKQRLHELQQHRDSTRMRRKLEHVAAAYIQYVVRKYLARRHRQQRLRWATLVITSFVAVHWRRRCRRRDAASRRIQLHWARYRHWRQRMASIRVVQTFVWSLIQRRRRRRVHAVRVLQAWTRQRLRHRRVTAVMRIQRRVRRFLDTLRRVHQADARRQRRITLHLDACARVIQLVVGRYAARRRLVRVFHAAFHRYQDLRDWHATARLTATKRSPDTWTEHRRQLAALSTAAKRLAQDETTLRSDVEALQAKTLEWRHKRDDEMERWRRCQAWAEAQRDKDDELMREQLRDWELRKRFEIRMELERELEIERRLRSRGGHDAGITTCRRVSAELEDARVEV